MYSSNVHKINFSNERDFKKKIPFWVGGMNDVNNRWLYYVGLLSNMMIKYGPSDQIQEGVNGFNYKFNQDRYFFKLS